MSTNGGEPRKHTIAVLVENKFGVLSRVAGLFSARGYNIESLSVGETLDASVSRMTLVVRGDRFIIDAQARYILKTTDDFVVKLDDEIKLRKRIGISFVHAAALPESLKQLSPARGDGRMLRGSEVRLCASLRSLTVVR